MSDVIYLDTAAATPLDERVLAAMTPYFSDMYYNPSATYLAAQKVKKALDEARAQVAHWLGARPSEIIFTAGGSEANNLAIHGVMRKFPDANCVVSAVEHDAVLTPAAHYNRRLASVLPDGRIDISKLRDLIDENTVIISVMYANNEVGTIQPIKEVTELVADIRKQRQRQGNTLPLYVHTDACQAANYLDLHVSRLGVDMMSLNGGKIYGPKQSGALYVKAGITLEPLIDGGGQEHGLRSGTENVSGCIGFATALDITQTIRHDETARLKDLQHYFFDSLTTAVPSAQINGSKKLRLPNNVHITIPGHDNERLLIQLDEAGILAAAGSACSASDEEPSHVLRAMGISDEQAQASVRITFGRSTTKDMLNVVLQKLSELCI